MNTVNENTTVQLSTRHIKVGERTIFLAEAGQGPALLLLHGGGPGASGVSNYSRNIEALAAHFHVLIPDMPGYGNSTKGIDRTDPFGDLAATMAGLLNALGIKKAHVIGNSLGGACGLRLALENPGLVNKLILMGPGGINMSRSEPTDGLKRLLGYYAGEGPTMEKLRAFILGDLVYDGTLVPDSVIEERFRSSIDPDVLAHPPLMGPITDPAKIDFLLDPRLPQIEVPVLVLWGTEDRVNPASGGPLLQNMMKRCDLYLFSRTGHWVQWERAHEFNAAAIAFLSSEQH